MGSVTLMPKKWEAVKKRERREKEKREREEREKRERREEERGERKRKEEKKRGREEREREEREGRERVPVTSQLTCNVTNLFDKIANVEQFILLNMLVFLSHRFPILSNPPPYISPPLCAQNCRVVQNNEPISTPRISVLNHLQEMSRWSLGRASSEFVMVVSNLSWEVAIEPRVELIKTCLKNDENISFCHLLVTPRWIQPINLSQPVQF